MSYTSDNLKDKIRRRVDMVDNPHLSDEKLEDYIEYATEDLYDLIVSIDPGYFKETFATFSTTSGTQDYALPSDMYKITSVNARRGQNEWRNVTRYNHAQRNNRYLWINRFQYHLFGDYIRFVPIPNANTEIRLEYIANPSKTTWDLPQFVEYIVVSAGIMALEDEESDTSGLERRLTKLEARIARYVIRDDAEPASVSDRLNNSYYSNEE